MKQILIALGLIVTGFTGADAQTRTHCGIDKGYVCHVHGKTADCYKTQYAQNFPVCKGPNGYYVCCNNEAAKQQDCNYEAALQPVKEKKTVICDRTGNIVACYEVQNKTTNYTTRINTD